MSLFKAVIFDFGGVFTSSPVEMFARFEKEHGLPEKFIGSVIKKNHLHNAWARYERSEIDRDEFDIAFAKESSAAGFEISGETLLSLLSLQLKHEMIDVLEKIVQQGFKTGCITNNLPDFSSTEMVKNPEEELLARQVMKTFDYVIESSKVGLRKPQPEIYTMMCDELNVPPDQCVFLDDLGINLKPARALGMATIKVPLGDVSPAINELTSLLGLSS